MRSSIYLESRTTYRYMYVYPCICINRSRLLRIVSHRMGSIPRYVHMCPPSNCRVRWKNDGSLFRLYLRYSPANIETLCLDMFCFSTDIVFQSNSNPTFINNSNYKCFYVDIESNYLMENRCDIMNFNEVRISKFLIECLVFFYRYRICIYRSF